MNTNIIRCKSENPDLLFQSQRNCFSATANLRVLQKEHSSRPNRIDPEFDKFSQPKSCFCRIVRRLRRRFLRFSKSNSFCSRARLSPSSTRGFLYSSLSNTTGTLTRFLEGLGCFSSAFFSQQLNAPWRALKNFFTPFVNVIYKFQIFGTKLKNNKIQKKGAKFKTQKKFFFPSLK